ncbi:hypothetical protein D3C71_1457100 [compost metagenome]
MIGAAPASTISGPLLRLSKSPSWASQKSPQADPSQSPAPPRDLYLRGLSTQDRARGKHETHSHLDRARLSGLRPLRGPPRSLHPCLVRDQGRDSDQPKRRLPLCRRHLDPRWRGQDRGPDQSLGHRMHPGGRHVRSQQGRDHDHERSHYDVPTPRLLRDHPMARRRSQGHAGRGLPDL